MGICYDSPSTNRAFRERDQLPFPLLSDRDRTVSALYGAKRSGLQRFLPVPKRVTYLIDPEGRVAAAYVVQDVKHHADRVLEDLKRLARG